MTIERATLEVPPSLALGATYSREVSVGIERIWENVLDWEHLPTLHEIFFDKVALIEIGSWGWRVELTKHPGRPAGEWSWSCGSTGPMGVIACAPSQVTV